MKNKYLHKSDIINNIFIFILIYIREKYHSLSDDSESKVVSFESIS
jgi:hypothetical protein